MADFINITFPFKDSNDGSYVNLNKDSNNAIKSDLMHLLLTNKGERFYLPDFGTNLKRYIFNQLDGTSLTEIKSDIDTTISKYIPKLRIINLTVEPSSENNYSAIVNIEYIVTDDVFENRDSITLKV